MIGARSELALCMHKYLKYINDLCIRKTMTDITLHTLSDVEKDTKEVLHVTPAEVVITAFICEKPANVYCLDCKKGMCIEHVTVSLTLTDLVIHHFYNNA